MRSWKSFFGRDDDLVDAERRERARVLLGADDGDDVSARADRDLDRGATDAPVRAGDEDPLAALDLAERDEIAVRGAERTVERGGVASAGMLSGSG